jgi:hypothetical protein
LNMAHCVGGFLPFMDRVSFWVSAFFGSLNVGRGFLHPMARSLGLGYWVLLAAL